MESFLSTAVFWGHKESFLIASFGRTARVSRVVTGPGTNICMYVFLATHSAVVV